MPKQIKPIKKLHFATGKLPDNDSPSALDDLINNGRTLPISLEEASSDWVENLTYSSQGLGNICDILITVFNKCSFSYIDFARYAGHLNVKEAFQREFWHSWTDHLIKIGKLKKVPANESLYDYETYLFI